MIDLLEGIVGLDGVELIMEVEETFSIKIEDREAEEVVRVGDLVKLVRSKLSVPSSRISAGVSMSDDIRTRVHQLVKRRLGVRRISDEMRFVDDLGLGQ